MRGAELPVVFSACQWLLHKLGDVFPADLVEASNDSWLVKRFADHPPIVFLRVEPQMVPGRKHGLPEIDLQRFRIEDEAGEDSPLKTGFLMASTEVPASLFFEYIRSLPPDNKSRIYFESEMIVLGATLDANLPAYNLVWSEAISFCNWLSQRDGREPVYEPFKFESDGTRCWKPIEGANGYRLPTILQWDAANRAGTKTRFFFGDTSSRIDQYAVTSFHSHEFEDIAVSPSGRKMPNDNGFFDLMGNASEWCEDQLGEIQPSQNFMKALRGADVLGVGLHYFSSGAIFHPIANGRLDPAGIRLVLPIDK
jgi:formylglycine-generating enzyme required for sulfatase activity